MRLLSTISSLLCLALAAGVPVNAEELEVSHWWTSVGETRALNVLKEKIAKQDHEWIDFAVSGGGGVNAMKVLKSRIISGNPPAAAQIKGPTVQNWGQLGLLADVHSVAEKEQWDDVLPEVIQSSLKVDGKYSAAPMNIHRINWWWINPKAFEAIKKPLPQTWEELAELAPQLRAKGFDPLALGKEEWQYATLFETVLLGTQGPDFYRKILVEQDQKALNSQRMVDTFKVLDSMRPILESDTLDHQWDYGTQLLVNNKAAVQLSGDWTKGDLVALGKKPGKDILCVPSPGTEDAFIYSIDSLVMFNLPGDQQKNAQLDLAKLLMQPDFQKTFSLKKGSIPIRQDVSLEHFDECSHKSFRSFQTSAENNTLVPSMANSMANSERIQRTFFEVIDHFFKNPELSPEQAARQLATAIQVTPQPDRK